MHLKIIAPDKIIFSGTVSSVQLPGTDGLFAVLENHAPLIAALGKGRAKIEGDCNTEFFEINGGLVEVLNNEITVLAD